MPTYQLKIRNVYNKKNSEWSRVYIWLRFPKQLLLVVGTGDRTYHTNFEQKAKPNVDARWFRNCQNCPRRYPNFPNKLHPTKILLAVAVLSVQWIIGVGNSGKTSWATYRSTEHGNIEFKICPRSLPSWGLRKFWFSDPTKIKFSVKLAPGVCGAGDFRPDKNPAQGRRAQCTMNYGSW